MGFRYVYVILFFGAIVALSAVLFPTYFDVATIHRNSYLYSTALSILDDLEQDSDDPRVTLERANVLYLVGRFDEAATVLERHTVRHPDHDKAWRQLAQTYRAMQQHRPAMASLERLREVAPADSEALYLLDEYYRWFQLPDQARDNLEHIVELFPQDGDSQERLVDLYLRMGEGGRAAGLLQRMSENAPDNSDALQELAGLYLAQRDPRAVDAYLRLHQKSPERAELFEGLLAALLAAGRPDDARERFEQYYASRLLPADMAVRRARLERVVGDRAAAIASYVAAEVADSTLDFSAEIAELHAEMGQFDAASTRAARLVRRQPANHNNWQLLVDYLASAGDRSQLITTLERYRQRWPQDAGMLLELADAYQWDEQYAAEVVALEQLARLRPDDDALMSRLAAAQVAAGRYAEAIGTYRRTWRRTSTWTPEGLDGLVQAAGTLEPGRRPCDLLATAAPFVRVDRGTTGLMLAAQLRTCGRQAAMATVYDRLLRGQNQNAAWLSQVGQHLAEAGDVVRAQRLFRRSLQLDATQPVALSGLAALLADSVPAESLSLLETLQRVRPEDGDVAYRRGLLHEARRDTISMRAAYQLALRQLPAAPTSTYGQRQRAHAMARTGQPDSALAVLRRAALQHPGNGDIAADAAALLLAEGRPQEALQWLVGVPRP